MKAKVTYDALIAVRILAEDVLYDNYYLLYDILGCDFGPDELLEGKDTPFSGLFNLNGDDANSRDGLAGESDVDLLGIILELGQKLINVREVSQPDH